MIYGGRVEPQELDREAIAVSAQQDQDVIQIPLEPRYIYSNRSYWYPQGSVTDYATARMRMSVPAEYDIIASGMPVEGVAADAPDQYRPASGRGRCSCSSRIGPSATSGASSAASRRSPARN